MNNFTTNPVIVPTTTYAYISKSAKNALSLKLALNLPTVPTKLDVLLLVDVTKSITTAMFSFLIDTYAKTFFSNVRQLVTNSYFGVATFTDQPAGTGCSASDYPFRLHLPLSSDVVCVSLPQVLLTHTTHHFSLTHHTPHSAHFICRLTS